MYMIFHPANCIHYYSFFNRVSFNVIKNCLEDSFIPKYILTIFSCPGNVYIEKVL